MCSRARGRANERIYGVGRCHQDGAMALSYRTRNSLSAPMSMKQSCISSVYTIYSRNNAPRALSLDQSATRHYSELDLSTERPRAHRAAALHTASLAPTQHRGVLGNHRASPRLDCRAAVCVQRANRARQQSARASQCEHAASRVLLYFGAPLLFLMVTPRCGAMLLLAPPCVGQ